ncbi:thaumatin-like protein [Mycena galericulata]|nr:thaumatin-like protein [Mycena galericulata]KAJ7507400.1 thaumatin-like protein [Mycena galericulata]
MKSFVATSLVMASTVAARTLTVYNACPFTIWPAIFTSAGGQPSQPTGWSAGAYTAVTFSVPSDWNGRVWGRRDCDFSSNPGPNSCIDGGCNGGLLCSPTDGTGVPPATLAEFNLDGDGQSDFYDVSLVDGYNLPMRIDNNVGCSIASCPVDLGPNCPAALKGPYDSTGFPVGCKSACLVDALNGNTANSPNCCTGSHDTAATCPPSGVTDYSYFKNNCPDAYAYAYDESSGTALWTCPANKNAVYTITFCPPPE